MKPSLTSAEDAAYAMPLPAGVAARLNAPGLDGVSARMNAAIVREVNIAIAREIDRGSALANILEGLERSLGVALACFIHGSEQTHSALPACANVWNNTMAALAALDRGTSEYTHASVDTTSGRA